jgi:hypothetical protein
MTAQERYALNHARLKLINPVLRIKVAAVLSDLEGHADCPLIDAGVWRSPAEQMAKWRAGVSRIKWSFHNANDRNGRPDALAADITDSRFGWDSPLSFWLRLAASAQAHGMESGIYWGLTAAPRAAISAAITARNWTPGNISRGWDPAHIQVAGISLLRARYGARP